jgi:hypothetical protein
MVPLCFVLFFCLSIEEEEEAFGQGIHVPGFEIQAQLFHENVKPI